MAKITQVFELKTETGDATRDIKKLDQDMTHLAETIGIEVSGSISAMEDKLYELAIQGKQNTEEFKKLQEQTARYKQIVIETDRSIDALAEQGRGLSNALAIAEGTVAGYQAFAGVSALLGSENEELLETMTKLQAAQGVLNSIMVIRQQLQEKSIALSRLQAAAQGAYNFVVRTSTGLLKLLRIAMASTGILLLVAGVAALIANFDKLIGVFGSVINGLKTFTDWIGLTDYASERAAQAETQRVQKAIAEIKQKRDELVKAYNKEQKEIDRSIKLRRLEGKEYSDLTKEKIELTIEHTKKLIESSKEELKALQSLNLERQKSLILVAANQAQIENINNQIQELNDQVLDAQIELKEEEKAVQDKRSENWKKHRDEQLAKEKKFRDELLKLQQQQNARMNALLDEIAKVEEDYLTSERDKAVNAVTDKYFRLIEEAKQYGQDTAILEQAQDAELKKLRDGFAREDLERARNAQNMITDNRLALMKEGQDREIAELQEKYNRERIAVQENEKLKEGEKLELLKQLKELEGQELKAISEKYAE
jgi:nitrate reductase NapAB chaperone NapD